MLGSTCSESPSYGCQSIRLPRAPAGAGFFFFFFLVLRVLSQGREWPEASFVCLALCQEPQSGLTSLPLLGFC